MKNIVLIGMPGTGKSTVGVLLAKSLLMDFCDTDLIIQKKFSKPLCDIITDIGSDGFVSAEDEILAQIKLDNTVIATGGSAVYGENAMKNLKENGIAVYLDTPLYELEKRLLNIHTRGVAMKAGTTLADLFNEREPLYKKYADITVECINLSPEECVERIVEMLNK